MKVLWVTLGASRGAGLSLRVLGLGWRFWSFLVEASPSDLRLGIEGLGVSANRAAPESLGHRATIRAF